MRQQTPPSDSLTTNRRWEQVWDRIWQQKGWLWRGVAVARDRYNDLGRRLLTRYLKPGDRLLELGCGTSQLTLSLAPQLKDLVGLDISDEALRLARAHQAKLGVSNATFLKADCRDVPYSEAFDVVWSAGLIEHFFEHDIDIVRQHLKATKPGGTVVLAVPYAYSLHRLHYLITRPHLLRWLWPWSQERHFQRFYSHRDLATLGARLDRPTNVFLLPPRALGWLLGIIILEIKKPR